MATKVLISLENWQIEKLDNIAKAHHSSRSGVVKEAINNLLKHELNEKKENLEHELLKFAGSWSNKRVDGLEYQRKLREEWEE